MSDPGCWNLEPEPNRAMPLLGETVHILPLFNIVLRLNKINYTNEDHVRWILISILH